MTNLDMNATSNSQWNTVNTDGIDTVSWLGESIPCEFRYTNISPPYQWNSNNIFLQNWTVTCGDDCISMKGNSSNVSL